MTSDDKDAEKRKSMRTAGGNLNWDATVQHGMVLLQKKRVAKRSSSSTSGIFPEEIRSLSRRNVSTPMLTPALFTMAETRKSPESPATREWARNSTREYR